MKSGIKKKKKARIFPIDDTEAMGQELKTIDELKIIKELRLLEEIKKVEHLDSLHGIYSFNGDVPSGITRVDMEIDISTNLETDSSNKDTMFDKRKTKHKIFGKKEKEIEMKKHPIPIPVKVQPEPGIQECPNMVNSNDLSETETDTNTITSKDDNDKTQNSSTTNPTAEQSSVSSNQSSVAPSAPIFQPILNNPMMRRSINRGRNAMMGIKMIR